MSISFRCGCGYSYEGDDPDGDLHEAPEGSCCNCGGRKCMDCVCRIMHDNCEDSCPMCCPPRFTVTPDQQAMHDALEILGFDNDGDKTPAAVIAGMGADGYRGYFLRCAREMRRDYDEALDESCPAPKRRVRREPTDAEWAAYAEAEKLHALDDVAAEFGIDLTEEAP